MSIDRRERIAASANTSVDGIDYVEVVNEGQTELHVHFLRGVVTAADIVTAADGASESEVTRVTITGGDVVTSVRVTRVELVEGADAPPVLSVTTERPGDFSFYTLTIEGIAKLDPYFRAVRFSFKAGCPTDLDCKPVAPECLDDDGGAPVIDYLAKDFASFKKALSDFSTQRYPGWQERGEADLGVMLMEALAAVADDLSYTQDRVAWEAYLETASQRRSLVRLARLVDYEPAPATIAHALLCVTVATDVTLPAGALVNSHGPDGQEVPFETGEGLTDLKQYPVRSAWNVLLPHLWDRDDACLRAGSTSLWVAGDATLGLQKGQRVVIETAQGSGEFPLRTAVVLADPALFIVERDSLQGDVSAIRIMWSADTAPLRDHDLTQTRLYANVLPVTQGRRQSDFFAIPGGASSGLPEALVRTGANRTPQYLHTLTRAPLAWRASPELGEALPEIMVTHANSGAPGGTLWTYVRSLLNAGDVDAEPSFTLDAARYARVGVDLREGTYRDYDGDAGDTLRFGDGVFGPLPEEGAVYEVSYRVGLGAVGNVAPDAIRDLGTSLLALGVIEAFNPFAAVGGADREPAERVRRLAPQAFRATSLRAVTPEDYQRTAESLPWVQRAGVTTRYTGSWYTTFLGVDPRGATAIDDVQQLELVRLLDRRRLAGRECYVTPPRYVSLDLEIEVCAVPDAFRGHVKQAVLTALDARLHVDGSTGFFHPDRFTFGVALELSALEAAIQGARGVDGVRSVKYRRRGTSIEFEAMFSNVAIGIREVLRVDNDPNHPERGAIKVNVEGGRG